MKRYLLIPLLLLCFGGIADAATGAPPVQTCTGTSIGWVYIAPNSDGGCAAFSVAIADGGKGGVIGFEYPGMATSSPTDCGVASSGTANGSYASGSCMTSNANDTVFVGVGISADQEGGFGGKAGGFGGKTGGVGGGETPPSLTALCARNSGSGNCTVPANAIVGSLIGVCQMDEGSTITAPSDSGSNSYTQDLNYTSSGGNQGCWHTKVTTQLTSGVGTITFGNFNNGFAFVINGLTSSQFDTGNSSTNYQVGTTAYTSLATSAVTSTDVCIGMAYGITPTMQTAGTGWTIVNSGLGANDSREGSYESGVFSTGTVTATATMTPSSTGTMTALCYK